MRRTPILVLTVVAGLVPVSGAYGAGFPIKTFPSSEKEVRAAPGQTWTMYGPGARARRRVVTFTVFVDGRARRVQEWINHDPSCTGAIDTGSVVVTVAACGRTARVRVESLDGTHTVSARWEWHPRLRRKTLRAAPRSERPASSEGEKSEQPERAPARPESDDELPPEDPRYPDASEDTPDDQVPVQEYEEEPDVDVYDEGPE